MELRAMPWHESIIESELAKTQVLVNATSIGLTTDDVARSRPRSSRRTCSCSTSSTPRTRLLRDAAAAGLPRSPTAS